MMMDEKGCWLIVAGASAIGLIVGLLLHWLGIVPWWGPLIGMALPVALGLVLMVYMVLQWMADGSH